MEHWQQMISAGNDAEQRGDHLVAMERYRQASRCARRLLDRWFDTEAALSALVTSDFKLAESQCRLGKFEQAIDTYASLSLDLRKFQFSFAPSNPIVAMVARALTFTKAEFLKLTQVYAYDILAAK